MGLADRPSRMISKRRPACHKKTDLRTAERDERQWKIGADGLGNGHRTAAKQRLEVIGEPIWRYGVKAAAVANHCEEKCFSANSSSGDQ